MHGGFRKAGFCQEEYQAFSLCLSQFGDQEGELEGSYQGEEELRKFLCHESMGFIMRSRFQETLETEKSSLFFMNRENKNFSKGSLSELKINNEVTSDEKVIEAVVMDYLGALFNGHHTRNEEDTGQPFSA